MRRTAQRGIEGFHGHPQVSRDRRYQVGGPVSAPNQHIADVRSAESRTRGDHAERRDFSVRSQDLAQNGPGSGRFQCGLFHGLFHDFKTIKHCDY